MQALRKAEACPELSFMGLLLPQEPGFFPPFFSSEQFFELFKHIPRKKQKTNKFRTLKKTNPHYSLSLGEAVCSNDLSKLMQSVNLRRLLCTASSTSN